MKNRYSKAKLMLAATLFVSSTSVLAAPRSVYIAGNVDSHGYFVWDAPLMSNAATYEENKLVETADGSNVYTGTFELSDKSPFRFYTELYDDTADGSNSSMGWISNIIAPSLDTDPAQGNNEQGSAYVIERGNTSVFDGTGLYSRLTPYTPSGWWLPADRQGTYKMLLDLNDLKNVKVTLIPVNKYYVVRAGQPTPSLASISDYAPVGNPDFIGYIPANETGFGLYDLSNEKWFNPTESFSMVYGSQGTLEGSPSASRGSFTLPDWPGGILTLIQGWNAPIYELAPDKPVVQPYTTTIATVIGDFCQWDNYEALQYNFADPTSAFDITLPAGTSSWKIILGTTWNEPNFGLKKVTQAADGSLVVALERDAGNIEFDVPLSAELTGHVDLSKLTITFPATAPLTASGAAADDDGSYPNYVDELLVEIKGYGVTPWSGASAAVMGTVTHLIKQADGTYQNGIVLDRPFRFISSRAPQGAIYEVVAPDDRGSMREIVMPDDTGHSSAMCTTSAKAGWWTVPADLVGTLVNVTVDNSGVTPKVTFYAESRKPSSASTPIYLIGSIQGWDIYDGSCALHPTSNGGYYGSFPVNGSDLLFRFYTTLGNWGYDGALPSFGSAPLDFTTSNIILDDTGTYSGWGTYGRGNWQIDNWSGDTMYAYVNIDTKQVIFANHPIAEAGELIPEDYKPDNMWIYDEADGSFSKMNKVGDDIFTAEIRTATPEAYKFRLFSALPTMSRDEVAWAATDSYVASSDAVGPDMFGVSEIDVAKADDTVTPAPLSITLDPDAQRFHYVTFDRAAGKVYFEPEYSSRIFLTGAIANGHELTYADRAVWSNLSVTENGGMVYIPEGMFDFTPVKGIHSCIQANAKPQRNVVWDADGMMTFPTDYSAYLYDGILDFSLKCDDWAGGNVAVKKFAIADLSSLGSITAILGNYQSSNSAKLMKQADGTFKGKIGYTTVSDAHSWLYFVVRENTTASYSTFNFTLGSQTIYTSTGSVLNEGANVIHSNDGTYREPIAFDGYTFSMPGLSGSGELDITLDLANMRMTAVNSGVEAPIYEAVADESSPLNGALIIPSAEDPDALVMETKAVTASAESPLEFNFARPDGSVLVPEGGATAIEFGKGGIYTGRIAVASTQRTLSRTALRTAASSAAKWQLSLPEGATSTDLHTVINEAEGTITIFSSAHNDDVYYISWFDNATFHSSYTSLLNLNDGKSRTITRNADGVFTGDFVAESASNSLIFHTVPDGMPTMNGSRIYVPYGSGELETFDLTASDEVTRPALAGYNFSNWNVIAPIGKVHIAFDPELCTLTMTANSASVEAIDAEAAGSLTLIPAEGCIRVYAPEATLIEVHNLSGALVKRVNAPAGHSTITLAPGFYTAAGTKLLVK